VPIADNILEQLDLNKERLFADLEKFVKIESPSTEPEQIAKAYQFLIDQFSGIDYYTLWVPGQNTGGYLYARPKNRRKFARVQLLIGHADTVWPVGSINEMPVELENDKIKGPGVYDMKAGLIQIIYAIKTLKSLNITPEVEPIVLINSDEEIGSKESTSIIRYLSKLADRVFILEPSFGSEGKLKTRRVGVGKYIIKIKGKSAHAGLDPGKGASAIVELSHVIQTLFLLNDAEKRISVNVGMIDGGIRPNVIAAESSAVVDVRVPTLEVGVRIDKEIKQLKPVNKDVELYIEGGIGRPPMEGTPANRALWELAKLSGNKLNIHLMEATAGGGSDGNTTSEYTGTLDGLGAVGDGAHAKHEFAYQSKIIERTALLCLLILAEPATTQAHEL